MGKPNGGDTKKYGSVRICVYYTKLNRVVKRERFQLPLAEEIFAKLRGAKFFTVFDAASGFWQIPINQGSEFTTFITPFGRYQFIRLPFGISGPEGFHRAMQHVLQDLDGVDCFIDDVIIWGATKEEHDRRLRQVLDRFGSKGVRLQPAKFMLRRSEVHYYGHALNGSGVTSDENRVKAILEMKQPGSPEELRRFLGLVAYVSKFIPGQCQTTAPLRNLLHNEAVWTWTPAQAQAFFQLKRLVATTRYLLIILKELLLLCPRTLRLMV